MENIRQQLIDSVKYQIEHVLKCIKESEQELKILRVELKVEKKVLSMDGLPQDIAESTKISIDTLENTLSIEESKIVDFKKELKRLEYREKAIERFEDAEL